MTMVYCPHCGKAHMIRWEDFAAYEGWDVAVNISCGCGCDFVAVTNDYDKQLEDVRVEDAWALRLDSRQRYEDRPMKERWYRMSYGKGELYVPYDAVPSSAREELSDLRIWGFAHSDGIDYMRVCNAKPKNRLFRRMGT